METTVLTPSQKNVLEQIRALKQYAARTGFKTTRSVNDLLEALNATDLAAVVAMLNVDDK